MPPSLPPLLKLSPLRALFDVAWPVIALGLLRSGYFLADAYWAGRLGADAPAALSALGASAFAIWILHTLGELAAVGTHTKVARATGAGTPAQIAGWITQGLWVAGTTGVLLAMVAHPIAAQFFATLGFGHEGFERPLALGHDFLDVVLLTSASLLLHVVVDAAFRGIGDTRTPMAISALTLALNVLLDPVLMFGAGPISPMGIAGAAWATALANVIAVIAGVIVLSVRGYRPRFDAPETSRVLFLLRVGLPQTISGVGFCLVYVFLGDILHRFGPEALAGLGIGHRLESASYQICFGFGCAAATLVGQNLGARRPREAARAAHLAAKVACLVMLPFTIATVLFGNALIAIWAPDPLTQQHGAGYLFAAGLVAMPMALEVVYEAAFSGAGETIPSMLVVLPLTAARIPLAAWLASIPALGIYGVWIAIGVTTAIKGLALLGVFRWRTQRRWQGADVLATPLV